MKVLLTAHQFVPDYQGGTEILAFNVAQQLLRWGHEVRVLCGWPAMSDEPATGHDEFVYEGIPVRRVYASFSAQASAAEHIRRDTENPLALQVFNELNASWRPDVVHAFHIQRLSAAIPLASTGAGVPTVYTPTDFWSMCPLSQLRLPDGRTCDGPEENAINCIAHIAIQGNRAYLAPLHRWFPSRLIGSVLERLPPWHMANGRPFDAIRALQERPASMRRMLRSFDCIVAPTSAMVERLVSAGADPTRIRRLAYGLDVAHLELCAPIKPSATLRLGFIGNLQPHKGAHVLLEAFKALDPQADASLSIYGDETANPKFVAQLRALSNGDSRVVFCGTFTPVLMPRVLESIDVLVTPSIWDENSPLVVMAALAARRPVVGSDVPGIAELVVDGVTGHLFRRGDATALATVLTRLIVDRNRLGALARAMPRCRSIADYTGDLLQLYAEVKAQHEARFHDGLA